MSLRKLHRRRKLDLTRSDSLFLRKGCRRGSTASFSMVRFGANRSGLTQRNARYWTWNTHVSRAMERSGVGFSESQRKLNDPMTRLLLIPLPQEPRSQFSARAITQTFLITRSHASCLVPHLTTEVQGVRNLPSNVQSHPSSVNLI
jgi:hypothetical protein